MRAVKFARYGGPDVLEVVDVARPAAGPGQVVVAVVTAATNPGEIGIREGRFAAIWPAHFPEGQGNDFAGYIAEIGSGVDDFAVGDEVLGFAPRAAQAAYVALNVDRITAKPAGLSWEALDCSPTRGRATDHRSPSVAFAGLAKHKASLYHSRDLVRCAATVPPQRDTEIPCNSRRTSRYDRQMRASRLVSHPDLLTTTTKLAGVFSPMSVHR
jgi:hypothetical protein